MLISSFLWSILLSSSFFLVSLASHLKSSLSISNIALSCSASKMIRFCLFSSASIFFSLGKAAASGGITGLGDICGLGCSATSVSGTVAVIVLTGGSGFTISSLAEAVTISAVSSAFIIALLPYSFSRASWNSLFLSSLIIFM